MKHDFDMNPALDTPGDTRLNSTKWNAPHVLETGENFLSDAEKSAIAANTAAKHDESHTVASHSDTTATGPELDELTDGSVTALHSHAGGGGAREPERVPEPAGSGAACSSSPRRAHQVAWSCTAAAPIRFGVPLLLPAGGCGGPVCGHP